MASGPVPRKRLSDQDPGKAPEPETAENVEKIREILFGSNIREYERRFSQIESRVSRDLNELKEEMRRRLAALETSVSHDAETLNARIEKERQERGDSNQKLTREVADLANNLEKKAREIEDRSVRVEREIREQIQAARNSAGDELRAQITELGASIDRRAAELREQKVDRAALASLLNELAMRLNHEPGLPNLETLAHGGATE